jgi:hypothetical protein
MVWERKKERKKIGYSTRGGEGMVDALSNASYLEGAFCIIIVTPMNNIVPLTCPLVH